MDFVKFKYRRNYVEVFNFDDSVSLTRQEIREFGIGAVLDRKGRIGTARIHQLRIPGISDYVRN